MNWRSFFSDKLLDPYLAGVFSGDYAFVGPMRVAICPTNRCNNNCIACWLKSPLLGDSQERIQEEEIPFEVLEKFLKDIHRLGTKSIIITGGGEPFLYPQINELILRVKSYGMSCDINTSFVPLTEKEILTLVKNDVDIVLASVWAGTANSYELLHPGRKAFFYRVRDNLKMLSRLKRQYKVSHPRIIITNVIMSLNFDKLTEMVEFALDVGAQSVMFNLVHIPVPRTKEMQHLLLNEEQAQLTLELAEKCESKMEERKRNGKTTVEFEFLPLFMKRLRSPFVSKGQYDREFMPERCYAGWSFLQLKPGGGLTSCCRVEDERGNIYRNRFEDVWNGKSQKEFRRITLNLKENIEKYHLPCCELCDNLYDISCIEKRFHGRPRRVIFISKLCGNLMKLLQTIRQRYHSSVKCAKESRMKLLSNVPRKTKLFMGILSKRHAYIGPEAVQIDVTNRCNNNCVYCWARSPLLEEKRASKKWESHQLPFDLVKRLIDDLHSMGTRHIHLSGGGEPFIHPHIMDILKYIKRKNMQCEITTNFTLINKEIAHKLVDLKIEAITASIWAGTAEMYSTLHPNKTEETFCRIKEVLNFLSSLKGKGNPPQLRIANVISNLNFDQIDKMIDFAEQTDVDMYFFQVMDPVPGKTDKLLLSELQCKQLKEKLASLTNRMQELHLKKNIHVCTLDDFLRRISSRNVVQGHYDQGITDSMPCYVGWVFSRITAEGNVNFCLKTDEYPIANLYKKNFREIWSSRDYELFRHRMLTKNGKSDTHFRCNTTCDNLFENKNISGKINSLSFWQRFLIKTTGIGYRAYLNLYS